MANFVSFVLKHPVYTYLNKNTGEKSENGEDVVVRCEGVGDAHNHRRPLTDE